MNTPSALMRAHGDRDRQGSVVPGQPNDANIVAEVLASELGTEPEVLCELEDGLLELLIPEPVAHCGVSGPRQIIEIMGAGEFRGLEREFRRGSADDDGQMIGRAGGGAEGGDLLGEEVEHRRLVEYGFRLLIEEGLVRASSALGHEQQLIIIGGAQRHLDLGGQVGAGVGFFEQARRCQLRVPEVEFFIGTADSARQMPGIIAVGEHIRPTFGRDDRCARVLAHRQDLPGGDRGILQQVEGDEDVVVAGFRIVDDRPEAGQMVGAQVVRDLFEGDLSEVGQGLRCHREERARRPAHLDGGRLHSPDVEPAHPRALAFGGQQR